MAENFDLIEDKDFEVEEESPNEIIKKRIEKLYEEETDENIKMGIKKVLDLLEV